MGPGGIVKLAAAHLQDVRIGSTASIEGVRRIYPDTLAIETGFKALDSNDGENQPEETNQERHIDKQGSGLLQTSEDNLYCISIES